MVLIISGGSVVKEGERAGAKKPQRGVLGCPARMKRKNLNFGTFVIPNHRREEGDLKWARQNASRALRRCAVGRGGWMGRGRNLRGGGEATTWLFKIRFRDKTKRSAWATLAIQWLAMIAYIVATVATMNGNSLGVLLPLKRCTNRSN